MLNRRRFLSYFPKAAIASGAMLATSYTARKAIAGQPIEPYVGGAGKPYVGAESAIEILMRGHGLMLRTLTVYEVVAEHIAKQAKLDPDLVLRTANIIYEYLERYHEKMEEEYIFKPMEKNRNNFDTIQVLKMQHGISYELTQRIIEEAKAGRINSALSDNMLAFCKMYKYHGAWEDTVIFPAFDVMPTRLEQPGFEELAIIFADSERKTFGQHGLGFFIREISAIENELNILGPEKWTPKL